jgi:signal transduction histidine kinase/CheY-like chemotaxis protein
MPDKILIVDDEPNNLDVLRNCLHEAGFTVLVAKNGETTLKRVNHIKPDLILLDIYMPGMDGFETCRRLKQNEAIKDTPVIFITAIKIGAIDKIKGLEIGAVDYITKPFQAEEVVARVNKHLTISHLQKQLEAQNTQLQLHVYHLSSLDILVKAINEAQDMAQMMDNAMNVTLSIFKCDRAWLLYPCDPNAPSWRVPIEVTKPEYPGANIFNKDIPMDSAVSENMKDCLSVTCPVAFGPEYEHQIPPTGVKQFSVQSQICMAIYPKLGKPWLFGIHQCSYARIWTENELNLFRDFGQHIGESLGVFISLNELQKSKEKAEEARHIAEVANQAKSDFLTNITHELRTPLNGILGFAQILQNDSSSTTKRQHGLNVIEQCGNHLLDLINDVLELTEVGTGKMELYETDFYLPSLLNGLSKIINIRAQDKEINFYLELANDLPNGVYGDERRLRQILLNLLGNAIKFTDQGSVTLQVKSEELKGEHLCSPPQQTQCRGEPACSPFCLLQFSIQDTGVGISPENLETIFEPFEQVGKQKFETKGTGLGLTISKNFVELMGGQLHVSSQINVGTQFLFEITLKKPSFSQKLGLSESNYNASQQLIIGDRVKETVEENHTAPMVFPPIAELEKLYELTLMADIDELEEQTAILAESDVKLKPFVTKMQALLKRYQVGQLIKWLEGAITK